MSQFSNDTIHKMGLILSELSVCLNEKDLNSNIDLREIYFNIISNLTKALNKFNGKHMEFFYYEDPLIENQIDDLINLVKECHITVQYLKYLNRCPSKAIKDVELKQAFIRLYNNMVKDKGSFFRSFYNNVEKVIGKNSVSTNIDKLTADINTFENDLSELIQLKIRHQIDDIFYNKEYQRIRSELDDLSEKKESLREVSLNQNKMQEKLDYIKKTISGNTEPLQEFDDELFKTLVEKVLVKDAKHVVFVFEDGLEFEAVLEKVKK